MVGVCGKVVGNAALTLIKIPVADEPVRIGGIIHIQMGLYLPGGQGPVPDAEFIQLLFCIDVRSALCAYFSIMRVCFCNQSPGRVRY